jgi:wyosine [tRNA(Phe)-imidazoG37] synthetase (radical SAM superfamily)
MKTMVQGVFLADEDRSSAKWVGPPRFVSRRSPEAVVSGPPGVAHSGRYVCGFVSQRGGGLCIDVNLNPDRRCNFDCRYCCVPRQRSARDGHLQLRRLQEELWHLLTLVSSGQLKEDEDYLRLPEDVRVLRRVLISGEGEPTLSQDFSAALTLISRLRAQPLCPYYQLVVLTNGSRLHLSPVRAGLRQLTRDDEIWVKLDAGSQAAFERVNRATMPLTAILANLLALARERPIVIQSHFARFDAQDPSLEEIQNYIDRLRELMRCGAQIATVQVYSAHYAAVLPGTSHLPLRSLSSIAQMVRDQTGLRTEVF